jgi:hypothetical protein
MSSEKNFNQMTPEEQEVYAVSISDKCMEVLKKAESECNALLAPIGMASDLYLKIKESPASPL